MATRQRTRGYDASLLKQLFERTGSWARNWDDVLRYLEDPVATFTTPELIDDVRHLKDDNIHFTTDYRKMWQELTGENIGNVPAPETLDDDPAARASSRMLDVLRRVESREYREMAQRMASGRTD